MSVGQLPLAAAPIADDGEAASTRGSASRRVHKPQRGPVRLVATRLTERCRA